MAKKKVTPRPTARAVCVHLKCGMKVIGGRIRSFCKGCGALLD